MRNIVTLLQQHEMFAGLFCLFTGVMPKKINATPPPPPTFDTQLINTPDISARSFVCEYQLTDKYSHSAELLGCFFPLKVGVGLVPKRGCLLTLSYYAFPR
jgi:hypothetical protein